MISSVVDAVRRSSLAMRTLVFSGGTVTFGVDSTVGGTGTLALLAATLAFWGGPFVPEW
jgi:hypothetical protein